MIRHQNLPDRDLVIAGSGNRDHVSRSHLALARLTPAVDVDSVCAQIDDPRFGNARPRVMGNLDPAIVLSSRVG